MSVQAAAHHLESPQGGAGLLLGGVPGTPAAKVTIIGGGVVGTEAAKIALGMRALVSVLDISPKRLAYLSDIFEGRADLVVPNRARDRGLRQAGRRGHWGRARARGESTRSSSRGRWSRACALGAWSPTSPSTRAGASKRRGRRRTRILRTSRRASYTTASPTYRGPWRDLDAGPYQRDVALSDQIEDKHRGRGGRR